MKRLISLVLTVMIATPCLAQEVEPEGISSLHGTGWVSTVLLNTAKIMSY